MTGQDVENFYFNNPPFEITDNGAYLTFLQFQSKMTMIELSENDPIETEHEIEPIPPVDPINTPNTPVLFDLRTIDPLFHEIIVLEEADKLCNMLHDPGMFIAQGTYSRFGFVGSIEVATAMRSNSVLNLLAVNDYLPIIEEWFASTKKYMVFDGFFIKLAPNTKYYMLYRRYKKLTELRQNELRTFQQLLGINLRLALYQSSTFSSEGGIKSVSLSGLSVTFNVPDLVNIVNNLIKMKQDLMTRIAMDYGDGCIGLI